MNATMIEVWGWKQNIMGVARIYKQLFIVFVTSPRCVRSLSPPPLPRWSRPTRYNKRVVYWFGRGPWLCFWFQTHYRYLGIKWIPPNSGRMNNMNESECSFWLSDCSIDLDLPGWVPAQDRWMIDIVSNIMMISSGIEHESTLACFVPPSRPYDAKERSLTCQHEL